MLTRFGTRVMPRPGLHSLLGFAVLACVASSAFALPSDGDVVSGSVSIRQVDPLSMQIYQTSDKAIVNWRGFSIAQGETLQFLQPGADAISLNRVLGSDPSSIFGQLSANGHVFLVNPNGVLFGPSASVNVGGFVASTLTIRDEDFLASRYTFTAEGYAGSVVNQGQLTAAEGGYVSLIGTHVINDGVITARLGTVALGAGQRLTLDFAGDDLIRVAVDEAAVDALVANGNLIRAEGGRVFLNASATNGLLNTVLNVDGVIEATSLSEHNGVIRLDGGSSGVVAINGKLDASGREANQTGGTVAVLGDKVGLFDGAAIDVSGGAGGGTVLVGGNLHGQGPEANANYTYVDQGAAIHADALQQGDGGGVVVWADQVTRFGGAISARGGLESGNGGLVEVSGKTGLVYQGLADLRAPSGGPGTLLLDPKNITIAVGGLDVINLADAFSELLSTDVTFSPASLQAALNLGNVVLQANNDITLSDPVTTLLLLTNNSLTLEAGRSIAINANLSLRGDFTATANTNNAAVVESDRTANTAATFAMADNVTINTSTNGGDITITMSTGDPAGTGFASGDLTIANLNAGTGDVLVSQGGQTPGSNILRTSNSLITANSVALDITNTGNTTGTIGVVGAPINVAVTNLEARTQGGDIFINAPTQGLNIGSASLGGLTGLDTNGGSLTLTTLGTLTESETLTVAGSTTLAAGSGNDITLDSAGNDFGGTLSIGSGNTVTLADANALNLGTSAVAGNLVVTTAGAITDSGALTVAGTATLAAGSANDITLDSALNDFLGAVSISSGRNVTLVDTNALDLGASTIAGNLLALAGGPITLSGALSVGGTTDLISLLSDDVDSISNQLDSAVATVQGTLPDALSGPLGGLPPVPPLDTPPIELPPILEPPGGTTDASDVLNIKNRDCEELILTERQSYVCREKSAKRPASPDE